MRDSILDFVGFEFITSHIGNEISKSRIPSNDYLLKNLKFKFLDHLAELSDEVFKQNFQPSEDLKKQLLDEVFHVKELYAKEFPDYNRFLACAYLFKDATYICTFVKAKTVKQALGHLKSYGFTDGTIYGNKEISNNDWINFCVKYVIQLSFKYYMVITELYVNDDPSSI
ncbi:hypothetical protein EZV73_09780 [Acidaminobacter sp. JC074]|uniref:hypothetical protein n=1 Tax=Acidaminobacter sp. JC074 TaxID=2530199 RepID=UPI001F0F3586|nr:hypothetical protein [Acidaminobacter sp. JC074]MCH4887863.1 hypothetical protein [Acidaminobacter sp. JC074]